MVDFTKISDIESPALSPREIAAQLIPYWGRIGGSAIVAAALGIAISYLIAPTYTARMTFLSPQPQQSSASAALASLGALSGLAGVAGGMKSPSDQYVALMQSETLSNRIIDRFKLLEVYDAKYNVDARKLLDAKIRISVGKKDGIITVEADDRDKQRAADIANAYLEELQKFSSTLALTEAQQRRIFFEKQLEQTRDKLASAQAKLQQSGFNAGALKSEPKAAAESYARIKAEAAGAEIRVQSLRRSLTEQSPELQQQLAILGGLRSQLAQLEQPLEMSGKQDYISAYRDYKYQESLFEIFSRQFELAKLDESRDGTVFQQIDHAKPPERKSKPKRIQFAFIALLLGGLGSVAVVLLKQRNATPNRLTHPT